MEEIIVTATKREQSAQDVGISVTAFSGAQTEALGLHTTQEIIQQVPGLQVQSFTPGFTTFNLRGIAQNNFQDNLEAPVAVYLDDIYIGSMNALNMQMFDMAATEVLRGPQGTLFGRNATGGLIHFRTRKAEEDELNGYAKVSFGERNNSVIEGALGGAFSDNVRGRIAARWEEADGYVEPGTVAAGVLGPTGFTATGSDAIGADGFVLRGNLQIDLSENTLLDLSATRTEDNDVASGHYVVRFTGAEPDTLFGTENGPVLTGDVHKHASDETATGLNRDSTVLSAHLRHEFESGMQLDYIGAFQDVFKFNQEDAGGGLVFFPFSTEADYEQQSHELRLSGENDSMRWQTGLYLLDIDYIGQARTGGPAIIGDPTGVVIQDTQLTSENWSIFSEAEFDLSDSLTLIAGARWSQDDKKINFINTASNFSAGSGILDGDVLFDLQSAIAASTDPSHANVDEVDYGDLAARLQLNYKVGDTLIYGSINRGIKGGNWSPSSAVTLDDFRHDEEDLLAYELGYKTTLLDGAGRMNAAIFYYDYSDYQAFSLSGGTPQVTNEDASAFGGEVEFVYTPNEHWDFNLGLALMDSEVDFIPGVIPGSGNRDVELPQSPSMSANYLARYNTDVGNGNFAFQLDGNWNDDHFMEGSNSIASRQESYAVSNVRASYAMENWMVSAWIRNFTDEEYLLYNLDLGFIGFVEQVYAAPRQAGITLRMSF
ncbi:MAG: TonB-dependent receptor [Woeseia sp.]|nr:TonB-dependent receptor [Woeseia sp.]